VVSRRTALVVIALLCPAFVSSHRWSVALRDSAGNKLSCDWTNDDDWQAIVGLAMENVRVAMGVRGCGWGWLVYTGASS